MGVKKLASSKPVLPKTGRPALLQQLQHSQPVFAVPDRTAGSGSDGLARLNGELMSSELFTCGCGGLATVGSVLFIQCHVGTGLSGFIARRHVFDVRGRDNEGL